MTTKEKFGKSIIFLFLLFASISGKAQLLNGTYVLDDKVASTKLVFTANAFKEESLKDGYILFGEGTYEFKNNKLLLHYTKALNKDSSSYKLKSTDKFSNEYSGVVTIKVMADSVPYPATVTFVDSVGKPIAGVETDSQGNAVATVYNSTAAKQISVAVVAFETVKIPISSLTRKISDLQVNMKMQTKNIFKPAGTVEYQVVKTSKDKLVLQVSGKQLIFTKSK